ncbi:MAG: energy transducer TonB [Pyrinomonadaceae bacterium]
MNPKTSPWQRALPAGTAALALAFSVGAGLLSHVQGNVAQAQSAGAGGTGGGGASAQRVKVRSRSRTQSGEGGPATEEILNAPESVVRFDHTEGSPLVFNDAKLKLITRDQLRRADDEGADFFDEEEKSEFLVTLPTVTLTNVSGKSVREIGIGFAKDGQVHVLMGYAVALKPGEARTLQSEWGRRNMIMPGTFADVSVRVVWATFADGSAWGMLPRTPHPPPPPPPPPAPGDSATFGMLPSSQSATLHMARTPGMAVGGAATADGGSGKGEGRGVGGGAGRGQGGGGRLGKLISGPSPAYPAIARSVRAQGAVAVRVTVDENGKVVAARAVSGHPLLRSAAEEAARAAQFEPELLDGKPVKVSGTISYHFALSGDEDEPEQ